MLESQVIFKKFDDDENCCKAVISTDEICFLCRHARSSDPVFQAVQQYISENIHSVHIDEICRQCSVLFKDECNIDIDPVVIKTHINYHMTEQTVVMQRLLTDLLDVSKKTKRKSFVPNEDKTDYNVDTKVVACYLKSVDEICNIYKSFYNKSAKNDEM